MNDSKAWVIKFQNVALGYEKQVVLRGLNFTIANGEKIFLIGQSGVGKSTILKALVDPRLIIKGKILFNNIDISELKGQALQQYRQQISWIAQEDFFINHLTILENLKNALHVPYYKYLFPSVRWNINQKIDQALKAVGLIKYKYALYGDLSGGQKKRVAIAFSKLGQKQLVLADEPAGALDIKMAKEVIDDLLKIKQTSLITMHRLDLIKKQNVRTLVIKNHQVILDCPFASIDENLWESFYD